MTTVSWIVDGNEGYGVRHVILKFSIRLSEAGYKVLILALHDGEFFQECKSSGLESYNLDIGVAPIRGGNPAQKIYNYFRSLVFDRTAAAIVAKKLIEVRADCVNVCYPRLVSLAGKAGSKSGIPTIWHMPNAISDRYPFDLNRSIYYHQFRKYHIHPIANSQYTARSLMGDAVALPPVIYPGVDPERFDPQHTKSVTRESIGIPSEAVVLGVFARLDPSKGQEILVRSIATLSEYSPRVHLLLLGGPIDGGFAEKLASMANTLGVNEQVHMLGLVPDPENYYSIVDVAVNSRVDPEPYGLSVIEAMMMKKPVLVHALGGPKETVIDGSTGWHITGMSTEAITKGIKRALDDRSRWSEMGTKARTRAVSEFSLASQVQRYGTILKGIQDKTDYAA